MSFKCSMLNGSHDKIEHLAFRIENYYYVYRGKESNPFQDGD